MDNSKGLPLRPATAAKSWPYFGLGGFIVALTAITGIVAIHADRSDAGVTTRPPAVESPESSVPSALTQQRPVLTYYLVDSPQQITTAHLFENKAQSDAVEASLTVQRRHHIFLIETPQDEVYTSTTIAITSAELEQAGNWDFQVIDLRYHN